MRENKKGTEQGFGERLIYKLPGAPFGQTAEDKKKPLKREKDNTNKTP